MKQSSGLHTPLQISSKQIEQMKIFNQGWTKELSVLSNQQG
ncbi:unnamed protein product [Paramecium octaurelia]|uniref:Uncharacterized protein n=1 Tax=Paramecium octaurelia TaxID=43137 RepID=A0A8S1W538_PAROT|nr:unnamed protein product [Paramecium octaurelia]